MTKAIRIGGGFLLGALIGYLICAWMAGYFYSPFVPSPEFFEGTSGTRYVMLVGAAIGAFLTSVLAESD